jgi:hypothetical protein
MLIRTEMSGVGHYGICTIVPRDGLEKLLVLFSGLPISESWENLDFDPWKPMGFGGSLRVLDKDPLEPEIKLAWSPGILSNAMVSHSLLMRGKETFGEEVKNSGALEVYLAKTSSGWCLQADFGDDIWDVIECPEFTEVLPKINAEIRFWWEDQSGMPRPGQYATVFDGQCGPTLQVYQPRGDGLWVAGSRNRRTGGCSQRQLTDHNTDSSRDCLLTCSLCV